jgi:hypothetical protein
MDHCLKGGGFMGRTVPPIKPVVDNYVYRLKRLSEILEEREAEFLEYFLEDIDSTVSLCMHIGVSDPLEVLFIHLLRRLSMLIDEHRCGEDKAG